MWIYDRTVYKSSLFSAWKNFKTYLRPKETKRILDSHSRYCIDTEDDLTNLESSWLLNLGDVQVDEGALNIGRKHLGRHY